MIKKLNTTQTYLALTSFRDDSVKSKLQFPICKDKFKELLLLLKDNITSEGMKALFEEISNNVNSLSTIKNNDRLMQKIQAFDKNYRNI